MGRSSAACWPSSSSSPVDCYPEGPERDAFLASVPAVLRLLHRLVPLRYDRLVAAALGPAPVSMPTPVPMPDPR